LCEGEIERIKSSYQEGVVTGFFYLKALFEFNFMSDYSFWIISSIAILYVRNYRILM